MRETGPGAIRRWEDSRHLVPSRLWVQSFPAGGSAAQPASRYSGRGCGASAEFWGFSRRKLGGCLRVGAELEWSAGGWGQGRRGAYWGSWRVCGREPCALRGGAAPEGVSQRLASVNARVCARRSSPGSERRAGVSLQPGLLPPAPLPRAPVPPSFPARPSPAGQALGRPGGAGGGELGRPGLCSAVGARAQPPPPRPRRAAPLPAGPRPVKLCGCGRRGG